MLEMGSGSLIDGDSAALVVIPRWRSELAGCSLLAVEDKELWLLTSRSP